MERILQIPHLLIKGNKIKESVKMSINNPYQTYQQNATNTASPGELTLMLYNGCLKFLKAAKKAMHEKNVEEKNTNLLKAQKIIRELMITLDPEMEVSQQMMPLYEYILNQLVEANLQNDVSMIVESEELVTQFRDTWKQVIQLNRQMKYGNGQAYGG